MPRSAGHVLALLTPGREDPPAGLRGSLDEALGEERVEWCDRLQGFLERLQERRWAAVLLHLDGVAVDPPLVKRVSEAADGCVLFLTAREVGIEAVLQAESLGATALLPHPPDAGTLRREILPLLEEVAHLRLPTDDAPAHGDGPTASAAMGRAAPAGDAVVGSSPALVEVYRTAVRVAAAHTTVLLTGESGTGKELVARILHRAGPRREGPFVPVNCAALPDTLLEAELFGYERGAFTGAAVRSEGRFGRAHGGTLFLDEVGEMSLALQAKLLRVLETGEVERLGAQATVEVDVRVVAATNRDLREEVAAGRFREDLLYRMAVVELELPPLRDRPEDIVPLTLHFVARFSVRHGRKIHALSRPAVEALRSHVWPGNVRELRNVLDRGVLMARGGVIRRTDLELGRDAPRTSPVDDDEAAAAGYPPSWTLHRVEGAHIRSVLARTGGHMGEAATILGVHRNTMTSKVREHGIDVDAVGPGGTSPAPSAPSR